MSRLRYNQEQWGGLQVKMRKAENLHEKLLTIFKKWGQKANICLEDLCLLQLSTA